MALPNPPNSSFSWCKHQIVLLIDLPLQSLENILQRSQPVWSHPNRFRIDLFFSEKRSKLVDMTTPTRHFACRFLKKPANESTILELSDDSWQVQTLRTPKTASELVEY